MCLMVFRSQEIWVAKGWGAPRCRGFGLGDLQRVGHLREAAVSAARLFLFPRRLAVKENGRAPAVPGVQLPVREHVLPLIRT